MNQEQNLAVFRAIDKLDRLGAEGVKQLLMEGRKDESGAWTAGAGLKEPQADLILYFLLNTQGASNQETLFKMRRFFAIMAMPEEELDKLISAVDALESAIKADIDPVPGPTSAS